MFLRRPLYATTADSRFMIWTTAAKKARLGLQRGRNTLIHGPAGAGKTTVLHQIEYHLRSADERPVLFVPLRGVSAVEEVRTAIINLALESGLLDSNEFEDERRRTVSDDAFAVTLSVRQLSALPGNTVILLDDVDSAVGHALFGRLRDELWQMPLIWGVGVDQDELGGVLSPPADAFFETVVALEPLSGEDRVELVKERAIHGFGDLSATQITDLGASGPGNPRRLVDYARLAAEDGVRPQDLIEAAAQRRIIAEEVAGRDGVMLVEVMEHLGTVSASDPRLAAELGWQRPRIASTLVRLEQAHLARSFLEAREGRSGRPRKLYELIPEAELVRR